MSETPELPDEDPRTELLHLWLEDGVMDGTLQLIDKDPAFWGAVLADLTRHIAEAITEESETDPAEVIREIRVAFDEDLNAPSEDGE